MNQKALLFLVFSLLLVGLGGGATYLLMSQAGVRTTDQIDTDTQTPVVSPTVFEPEPTIEVIDEEVVEQASESAVPQGWLTYTNTQYGFEISYPEDFKALDDAENLYGWPDAVVLFYAGGQSYDMPVEVWDTKTEYENKYSTQIDNLTVKRVGDKYITLLNMNRQAEVDQIIETFKETE
jgi:hypothetical protein